MQYTHLGPSIQRQYFFLEYSLILSSISLFFLASLLMHKAFVSRKLCISKRNLRTSILFKANSSSIQETCSLKTRLKKIITYFFEKKFQNRYIFAFNLFTWYSDVFIILPNNSSIH